MSTCWLFLKSKFSMHALNWSNISLWRAMSVDKISSRNCYNDSRYYSTKPNQKQESPAVARENELQPIRFFGPLCIKSRQALFDATPTTYRLATTPHDWHTVVRYDPSRSPKVIDFYVIWKPIYDFLLMIDSHLGPVSHRLATLHPWQTDGQTDDTPCHKRCTA